MKIKIATLDDWLKISNSSAEKIESQSDDQDSISSSDSLITR